MCVIVVVQLPLPTTHMQLQLRLPLHKNYCHYKNTVVNVRSFWPVIMRSLWPANVPLIMTVIVLQLHVHEKNVHVVAFHHSHQHTWYFCVTIIILYLLI